MNIKTFNSENQKICIIIVWIAEAVMFGQIGEVLTDVLPVWDKRYCMLIVVELFDNILSCLLWLFIILLFFSITATYDIVSQVFAF